MKNEASSLSKYSGDLVIFLTCMIWGVTFALVRDSLNDCSPILFVGVRFLLAIIFFLPFVIKDLPKLNKDYIKVSFLLGLFYGAGFFFQAGALQFSAAPRVGFLSVLLVIFIPLIEVFYYKKPVSKQIVLATLVAIAGSFLLANPSESGQSSLLGDLMGIGSALAFAAHISFLGTVSRNYDIKLLTFMQIVFMCFFAALLSGFESPRIEFTDRLMYSLLYLSLIATVIACYLQAWGQKRTKPVRVGFIYISEPILAAIFAYFWLGELLSKTESIGAGLLIIAIIICLTEKQPDIRAVNQEKANL